MPYDNRHCWLTRRSHPWRSHPMLYGCRCGVVDNSNCLTTSAEMRFFWLPLSTIKCSRVPFTHICEWKRRSPSSGSVGSSGWIAAVATIAVGSASMICPLPVFSESDYESGFGSLSLISTTNDCFGRHSSVLCQGLLWKSHHFLVSFFVFPWPFFSCGLGWFSGDCLLGTSLSYCLLLRICRTKIPFVVVLKFLLDFNNISIGSTEWWDVQKIHFSLDVSV